MKNGRQAPLRFCRENLFMRKLPALLLTLLLLDAQNILFWDGFISLDQVKNNVKQKCNKYKYKKTEMQQTKIQQTEIHENIVD